MYSKRILNMVIAKRNKAGEKIRLPPPPPKMPFLPICNRTGGAYICPRRRSCKAARSETRVCIRRPQIGKTNELLPQALI